MTAFLIAVVLVVVGAVALLVPPFRDARARRRQADAADERQATDYWTGLAALPLDANPEGHANDVDRVRRATRPSELPHQHNRGRTQ